MSAFLGASILSLFAVVACQQAGTLTKETHPTLTSQQCTKGGGCKKLSTSVVLDSNWRWTHATNGSTNCYTGNTWNAELCPDPVTCANNCALDGADYSGTYGIRSNSSALTLDFVTHGPSSTNVGSRVYLMASNTEYQMVKLKNQEFAFDVDVSKLPCGLNGALYFVAMDADGGKSQYANNKAGAQFGTGYCDAQCARDIKFMNGEANLLNWTASDANSGTGKYGTCCPEMDIWEANSIAAAYTPHPCSADTQTRCSGADCDRGRTCDNDGCDFNSYRLGDTKYFGKGMVVDTTSPFTVVTQFITSDDTSSGELTEIRRHYVQNGHVIQNSKVKIPGVGAFDSITDKFCAQQKAAFGDPNTFKSKGGMAAMSKAMENGMVLALSLWDDHTADMLWLDSSFNRNNQTSPRGVTRGTCATTSGRPDSVESEYPSASVTFSNIRWGDIGSTSLA